MANTVQSEVRFAGQGGDELRAVVLRNPLQDCGADGVATRAGVVFVHDAFGLDDGMLAACERLAATGRTVLAVDLYARESSPPAQPRTAEAARALARAIPDRRVLADVGAALERLAREPDVDPRRIALVGLGAGGTWAFLAACASSRAAAVVDLGGRLVHDELDRETPLQPLEMALNLGAPLLAVFAADEGAPPPGEVEHVRTVLTQFAREHELHELSGSAASLADAEEVWSLVGDFLDLNA